MWPMVRKREIGVTHPHCFANYLKRKRVQNIQLSSYKEIVSAHKGGVNSIQVDNTDSRYLLAGASDGSVAAYDIEQASDYDHFHQSSKHKALFVVDKNVQHGHRYLVSCVHWYPVDTGIFVTGAFDHFVNVWDANTAQVELQFNMSKKVYDISMSNLATTHMLIATGTEDTRVRLCDIASGAFTHTLTGHKDSVWAVQWSNANEWILVSGGCDGAIRFWDIRTTGCFQVLDQHHSQIGRRPPLVNGNIVEPIHKKRKLVSSSSQLSYPRKIHSRNQKDQKQIRASAASDPRVAHYGCVTGLQMTSDGAYLLSSGADSRLRMWDVESGCNTLVNYPATKIKGNKPTQMAISTESYLLFVPCLNSISVYDVWSGQMHCSLRGHYDLVNCCAFHPLQQELYSGSNDRSILVWAPPSPLGVEESMEASKDHAVPPDEDTWSD